MIAVHLTRTVPETNFRDIQRDNLKPMSKWVDEKYKEVKAALASAASEQERAQLCHSNKLEFGIRYCEQVGILANSRKAFITFHKPTGSQLVDDLNNGRASLPCVAACNSVQVGLRYFHLGRNDCNRVVHKDELYIEHSQMVRMWRRFLKFLGMNVLEKKEFIGDHAFLLTELKIYDTETQVTLMSSWGNKWAQNGQLKTTTTASLKTFDYSWEYVIMTDITYEE
ncbi:hypothetical protein QR680_011458 [Steinernema hermaphroditum]|uniref:Uncharacterized protein n=1 Tax=Steinernema hermaphroditum TaxID=289476 RepID=A0AA39I161_9BILA|nr:hypothetical protein QR680_011458 [Steinernema hermaphroditum]